MHQISTFWLPWTLYLATVTPFTVLFIVYCLLLLLPCIWCNVHFGFRLVSVLFYPSGFFLEFRNDILKAWTVSSFWWQKIAWLFDNYQAIKQTINNQSNKQSNKQSINYNLSGLLLFAYSSHSAHLQESNYDSSDTDYEKPSKDALSSQKKVSAFF